MIELMPDDIAGAVKMIFMIVGIIYLRKASFSMKRNDFSSGATLVFIVVYMTGLEISVPYPYSIQGYHWVYLGELFASAFTGSAETKGIFHVIFGAGLFTAFIALIFLCFLRPFKLLKENG